jgi:hypothetical protein
MSFMGTTRCQCNGDVRLDPARAPITDENLCVLSSTGP